MTDGVELPDDHAVLVIAPGGRRVDEAKVGTVTSAGVASPCVNVCRMDAASGLCEGCLRTIDEIAAWATLADDDKRAVWQRIEQRRTWADARSEGAR